MTEVFLRNLEFLSIEWSMSDFDLLEVVDITPREALVYDPAIFGGELGSCNPGA